MNSHPLVCDINFYPAIKIYMRDWKPLAFGGEIVPHAWTNGDDELYIHLMTIQNGQSDVCLIYSPLDDYMIVLHESGPTKNLEEQLRRMFNRVLPKWREMFEPQEDDDEEEIPF